MVHGERKNGKAHGVVSTKKSVVCKMLDLVNYTSNKDLRGIKILEPSSGEGAFALEIIKRLYQSSKIYNFDFEAKLSNIYLCEIDSEIFKTLHVNISKYLESIDIVSHKINFFNSDFLLIKIDIKFDLVVGNPPYVRNENIPLETRKIYQSNFTTFTHRSDLFIPFYEKGLKLLSKGGVLSYVCSNRWLKNQYGKRLRRMISSQFKVDFVLNLEEADIFDEEVLGYPAITNISNNRPKENPPYYELDDINELLSFNFDQEPVTDLNLKTLDWFPYLLTGAPYEKNIDKIENQNFKIGIGVATGRDTIFIRKDFKTFVEKELVIPILTSRDVKGVDINWHGNYLFNPYDNNGNLIDIEDFPKAKKYLLIHKDNLSSRHVSKRNPNKWYRTIDKINIDLIACPKVILPDISGNRYIHVDKGLYYPHHNLYYIIGGNYTKMCLLASILMSDFVYDQLLAIGNKMNGGYPRWQSQNLRKLVIPIINSIPESVKQDLLDAYSRNNLAEINDIVTIKNIESFDLLEGQLALFEPAIEYKNRLR